MPLANIKSILLRDLERLSSELSQYPSEELLWEKLPGTSNSAGNLALHLIGNLRHFIGSVIGKSGYVRNREEEFSLSGVDRHDLTDLIEKCRKEVDAAFNQLKPEDLDFDFPLEVSGKKSTTGFLLLHLISHFNYHLGQINYHRRAVSIVPPEL